MEQAPAKDKIKRKTKKKLIIKSSSSSSSKKISPLKEEKSTQAQQTKSKKQKKNPQAQQTKSKKQKTKKRRKLIIASSSTLDLDKEKPLENKNENKTDLNITEQITKMFLGPTLPPMIFSEIQQNLSEYEVNQFDVNNELTGIEFFSPYNNFTNVDPGLNENNTLLFDVVP